MWLVITWLVRLYGWLFRTVEWCRWKLLAWWQGPGRVPQFEHVNDIPPREQWLTNWGYCAELSFIQAGLYHGQYMSQYDARDIAEPNVPQTQERSQLILGINDIRAAEKMRLDAVHWNSKLNKSSEKYLLWVKKHVVLGYPVIISVYMNMWLFEKDKNPRAGDEWCDHIVTVHGIRSNRLNDFDNFCPEDQLLLLDHAVWGNHQNVFSFTFGEFVKSRRDANAKSGRPYSLPRPPNFAVVVKGILDERNETLPVRVKLFPMYELPEISGGRRPEPCQMRLIVTVSSLQVGKEYCLMRFDHHSDVPGHSFMKHVGKCGRTWMFVATAQTWSVTEKIKSSDQLFYRVVERK